VLVWTMVGTAFAGGPPATDIPAEEEKKPTDVAAPVFHRQATGWGLGIILGLPTGLSAAYRPAEGRAHYAAALAWSFDKGTLHTHFDAYLTIVDLRTEEIPDVRFPLYVGVGPRLRIGDSPYTTGDDVIDLGIRIPLGMAFMHDDVPLEAFLEVAPGIGLYPSTRAIFDVALGGRYYFK
jgi:hypothetical protein